MMNASRPHPTRRLLRWFCLAACLFPALFAALLMMDHPQAVLGTLLASQARAAGEPVAAQDQETSRSEPAKKDEESSGTFSVFQMDPLSKLAESLQEKERQLKEREERLAAEEKRLEALRKETEQNLNRIELRLKEMQAIATQADSQNKKELTKWVDIYQAMAPKDAGKVIQGMDPELAKAVLSQMEPKKAGKILGFVSPDKATAWSKLLNAKSP